MTTSDRLSWKDVRDKIHAAILTGRYAPGDQLPKDADIAERLNCARSTVQRAMQDLSDSGLVERRRRGGTRVRPDPVTRATFDIPLIRHEVEQSGGRYGYLLVQCIETTPPSAILAACEMAAPAPMLRVEALHLCDARPFMFEDRWINIDTVPEIRDVDLESQSANEWLVLNRPCSRCDVQIYAMSAGKELAEHLATAEGAAVLVVERTTWIDNRPITTVKTIAAPGYRIVPRG